MTQIGTAQPLAATKGRELRITNYESGLADFPALVLGSENLRGPGRNRRIVVPIKRTAISLNLCSSVSSVDQLFFSIADALGEASSDPPRR